MTDYTRLYPQEECVVANPDRFCPVMAEFAGDHDIGHRRINGTIHFPALLGYT